MIGLIVNLACALALGSDETGGSHDHSHGHSHGHDHNFQAAYLHVLADALTSVLAIIALVLGSKGAAWGINLAWLDPAIGVLGGVIILKWSVGLCRSSAKVLLDVAPSVEVVDGVREALERNSGLAVLDLHIWDMGLGRQACMVSISTDQPAPVLIYRQQVNSVFPFTHLTIEVNGLTQTLPTVASHESTDIQDHHDDHHHDHSHDHHHKH